MHVGALPQDYWCAELEVGQGFRVLGGLSTVAGRQDALKRIGMSLQLYCMQLKHMHSDALCCQAIV